MARADQSRREFLQTLGAMGAGSLLTSVGSLANASMTAGLGDDQGVVPIRPFGKTGVDVPILSFGGSLDISQLMLRQAAKWGVTYWDTAASYMGGNSEKRIGKYLEKYPEDRKKIFLVTKSYAWSSSGMTDDLHTSLNRLKTDTIDLFLKHSVRNPDDLDDELEAWAEKRKAEGKIRFFGFSSHSNMENCLLQASTLGWIDGIMMEYNFRLMHTDRMKRAVDACVQAGIGLTAMKTQGGGSVKTETQTDLEMAGRFLEQGFTDAQAKLMAVWQNPAIASICSEMPNMTILMANVAAALNKTRLSTQNLLLLQRYAQETRSDYCAGCCDICEATIDNQVPVSDIMRYLKYSRSYGDRDRARALFQELPRATRDRLTATDYSAAEQKCPHRMPIARLMREAALELS